MKIHLIFSIIVLLNSFFLVYPQELVPIILQSSGGFIGASYVSIGKQQFSIRSRGITAIAFNPSDLNTFRIKGDDAYHWVPDMDDSPSEYILTWLKHIEAFSPDWVVVLVSNDDSTVSMSKNLNSWLSKFGLKFGFRGSWLLTLQTNGISYKNLGSNYSVDKDSTVSKGPILVSVKN
ncbi:hypothetical protein ACTA71_006473 [Dictyostelium dimigraforme]